MADVRLEDAVKKFGNTTALDKLSFECREGEFFTLLGSSGAGKTTTLDVIAGLKKLDSGNVYMGGECVNDLPPQERDVAMAFENYALYSHLTNYENIAFPLRSPKRTEKLSPGEEKEKVMWIATRLGIDEYLDRMPKQLSGGQKQRVSLARAMVRRPSVYLLDEPIAHLDAKLRALARSDLKKIAGEYGTTIIYVTHNYHEALALSDRILIMRAGKAEQIDTPENIYNEPQTDYVANLVGDPPANLIDGELVDENNKLCFKFEENSIALTERAAGDAAENSWELDGSRMSRFMIRPEDITVSEDTAASAASCRMRVYATERKDENELLKFRVLDTLIIANAGKVSHKHKVNDIITLNFDLNKAHFYKRTFDLA